MRSARFFASANMLIPQVDSPPGELTSFRARCVEVVKRNTRINDEIAYGFGSP
jgi:hypothetical protein